jgi:hypothetical protein
MKKPVKQPWEMSRKEFEQAVKRGKLHPATDRRVSGEEDAKTPLRVGELNGYSGDDIARFYAARRGYGNRNLPKTKAGKKYDSIGAGRIELVDDALYEGRNVPKEVIEECRKLDRETHVRGPRRKRSWD